MLQLPPSSDAILNSDIYMRVPSNNNMFIELKIFNYLKFTKIIQIHIRKILNIFIINVTIKTAYVIVYA